MLLLGWLSMQPLLQAGLTSQLPDRGKDYRNREKSLLFPSDAEDVGMIERASNGVLTATIVARCDEPELTHLCVIQVERLE